MTVLIVTGAIGSGKSTAVDVVVEELEHAGKPSLRLHLDELARELISADEKILAELKDVFGPYVVSVEGELNRTALASVAFRSPESVASLNEITHPHVLARVSEIIDEYLNKEPRGTVVMESPYPFGLDSYEPLTLYIYAPFELRTEHNTRFAATDFEARNRVQASEQSYRSSSDFEIENTFHLPSFKAAIQSFVESQLL